MTLDDADDAHVLAGANVALLGDEILQFGRATPIGGSDWRLSVLWRGRRGREDFAVNHPAGTPFALLEPQSLKRLDPRFAVAGVKIMAIGVGDVTGVVADAPVQVGRATLPLSPVNVAATLFAGSLTITWTRRSRDGWLWRDAIDVPIAEQSERYAIVKRVAGRDDLSTTADAPTWTYTNSELTADRAAGATSALIDVRQVGTFGLSPPATITITL